MEIKSIKEQLGYFLLSRRTRNEKFISMENRYYKCFSMARNIVLQRDESCFYMAERLC